MGAESGGRVVYPQFKFRGVPQNLAAFTLLSQNFVRDVMLALWENKAAEIREEN